MYNNNELKVYDRFLKRLEIYSKFQDILNINLNGSFKGHMNLQIKSENGLYDKISVCIIKTFENDKWKNEIDSANNTIKESLKSKKNIYEPKYNCRYLFTYNKEKGKLYFEFIGIYYYDKGSSKDDKRIWKKYNNDKVSLDIKKVEKDMCLLLKQ